MTSLPCLCDTKSIFDCAHFTENSFAFGFILRAFLVHVWNHDLSKRMVRGAVQLENELKSMFCGRTEKGY